ncbi:rod shape-determining protein MreD [Cellulosilyticum sp. I15G10I2]|uniref:rod shape-determining protein MreD n=1 Tax=Cellulosilyticum sp. I15G10I2 TaxID=1892843 RepID=UPI00085CA7AA|nr:rod shape-determining protein MreD [Cellulosilyticum sp. I15G10I2]
MRISIISILLLLMHALSTTLFQVLRIGDVAPNFMIMIIVSFALLRGSKEGCIIGIAAGLLNDISFGTFLGPGAVIYAIIGYICGKFNKNFYRENFIIPFICTLFSSLFYSTVSMLGFILRGKINFIFFTKSIIIPELIYTITLSLVIYQFAYVINEKIEYNERKTRNIF